MNGRRRKFPAEVPETARQCSCAPLRHEGCSILLTWPNADAFPQWLNRAPLFHAIRTFLDALGTPGLDEKNNGSVPLTWFL
jgi:hypothetical protein